jgi:hypothetical protein
MAPLVRRACNTYLRTTSWTWSSLAARCCCSRSRDCEDCCIALAVGTSQCYTRKIIKRCKKQSRTAILSAAKKNAATVHTNVCAHFNAAYYPIEVETYGYLDQTPKCDPRSTFRQGAIDLSPQETCAPKEDARRACVRGKQGSRKKRTTRRF